MLIFQKLIGADKNKQKSVPMYHERAIMQNRTAKNKGLLPMQHQPMA